MPLVNSKELLLDAQKHGYAVGAFNVENMEMLQAVTWAAQEKNSPVILQTTASTLRYATPDFFAGMARAAAGRLSVPVVMHLDHGDSYELACECIEAGYTSVMIDGSKLPFEENCELARRVVEFAHLRGVSVEAELGTVGGKEDDTVSAGDQYTDPVQAAEFVKRTGVDSLAIGFGTAHGFYSVPPVLDLGRISLVRDKVAQPLVMHGTSGIASLEVQTAIRNGICKVNYATELRQAFTKGVQTYLAHNPEAVDPKKYMDVGRSFVKELVAQRIDELRAARFTGGLSERGDGRI